MLYIFDRDEKVVGFLQSNSDRNKNIYYNDVLTEILSSGADSFAFTAISDRDTSKNLTVGNYIAFKKGDKFKLMQIMEVNESRENALTKEIYCEGAGLELINTVYSGSKMSTVNIESFLKNVLQDTNWEVGYIDSNLTKTLSLEIEEKEVYSIIQEYLYDFEAEIDFRVEIKGNRIVGRYIDVYSKRGRNNGRRLEINRDIKSISRKVSLTEYATKLIGEGKNGLNFRDISMSGEINKPLGQNFVVNEEAYSRINNKGKHITRKFTYDTEDAYELLRQTYKALKEYSEPKVTYEVDADILNFDDIEIGDYVSISDLSFTPPLLVTARISELETSKTNKYANKAILSNFNEVRSGISSIFPIPGDNIVSGSIGGEQMNPDYVDSIISDSVNTTMIKTEILLANKANIEDLNATNAEIENLKVNKAEISDLNVTNAEIENLKVDKADVTDLNATNANIENLKADKADIADLNATNATIEELKANKADITDLNAINANIDKLTANKAEITELEAVKADIGSLTAGKADIGMLDSVNANIEILKAGYAKIEDLDANKANIEDLNATNATIENLKVNVANIDKLVANKADIEDLNATNANIDKLVAKDAQIENLVAEKADISQLNAANANIGTLTANLARVEDLVAQKANIGDLNATNANVENLKAGQAEIEVLVASKASIEDLKSTNASIGQLQANKADIGQLNAAVGEITQLKSEVAEIGTLKGEVADIEHILAGNIGADNIAAGAITSDKIQTGAITAGSGIIANGAIGSAQISSIDAGKISTGTVDTSKVTIQGTNGHLKIKGNRLQVFNGIGSNAKERVSLGDVNGNGSVYGLRVRGADGTTILLDENGVKSEGITDGAITNDKISDDANIDGAKLNINSVVSKINEDGTETIQGTKIEVDGTTLNTKLSTITNKQTEDSERITQAQSQITANTNAIKLKVDEQTYTTDKKDMTSKLEKNTSEISTMKGQIALKVEQTDIENAKSEMEGVIDTKVDSAKAEIKVTTDAITQNVSNLSQTVSNKADGSTVTTLSNKVGSLETGVNSITGKVTSLEKTTTTLGNQVTNAQDTADSAINKANNAQSTANSANSTANTNKSNITNLQGEVSTVKSDIASLEVTTSGISQKVSSVESTTATLTTKVTNAQNAANSAQSTANSANSSATNALNKANSANTLADSKAKVFTSTPTVPYKVGDLWVQGTTGEIMKCKTARTSGSYTASDWEKASKYTDDTKANAVDGKLTTLQGEYNTTKSQVATLETNLDGITQRVSSTESTTSSLTTKVNNAQSTANSAVSKADTAQSTANTAKTNAATAQSTADSAKTTATNAQNQANTNKGNITTLQNTVTTTNNKVASLETNLNSITSRVSATETTTNTLTTKVDNMKIGGRNLIRKADVGQNNSTATFNDATKTWTIKATAGSGGTWGSGLVLKNKNILVPYGKQYVLSFEIKVPRNCSWNTDVNNYALTGSSWNSNDNDNISKRSTSSKSLTANQWIKCWSKWENTHASNTNKVDLYDNSNFGVVMKDETSDMTYEIRNIQGELGNIPTEYTPAPEDVDSAITAVDNKVNSANTNISNLTTRVSTAESKLTKDSLTTTIGNHYTTSTDVNGIVTSKGYQTQSQVQQTVDGLQVKVQQSGGYNLLRNSGFKKDSLHWGTQNHNSPTGGSIGYLNHTAEWGFPNANVKCCQIRLSNQTSKEYGIAQTFNTTIGKKYTISFYYAGHRVPKANMIIRGTSSNTASWLTSKNFVPTSKNGGNASIDNWALFTHTFTATLNSHTLNIVINDANNDGYMWIAQPMIEEGELHNPYSPHPSEIYDGVTTIDKDGVTVTASNVKSKTNMSANGFKITKTDTNEDVFKVNSDGTLYMKGQITVTGGSVPTSNLSGTISSNQLNSSITSDINNAKNNASSALSTANTAKNTADTAKSTADSAKSTATSAQNTANTASTNATNALNTANSVNSTVNSNKNNWNNAYNRVSEWAYGAVTGSTNINGGMIATNTITANKMAIADFTNYCEMNIDNCSTYGFTKTTDSSASNNYWMKLNSLARDIAIVSKKNYDAYKGNVQGTYRISFEFNSTVKGATTSGGTDSVLRPIGVGLYCKDVTGVSKWYIVSCSSFTSGANTTYSGTVTLDSSIVSFGVYVQINGYAPFTGQLLIRNIKVNKMANGELIVDGAITADKIASRVINADKIASGTITSNEIKTGTITSDKIASRTITADRIAAGVLTANEIKTGTITSDRIASRTITADRIAAGVLTANEIAANTITADKIASRTITADKIAAGAITANEIKASTITATQMASNSVTADKIAAGAITANKIASGAITATMITSGTLDASKVTVTNLNASNIKSGKLSANYIDATNLSVKGELLSGQINGIGGMKFADGAVISSCESGVAGYKGIQISAPVIKLGDKVEINRPTIFYDVTGKNNSSSKTTTWTMSSSGGLNCSTINTTGTTTVGGTLNVRNNMINGMNNLQMGRGSVYIPIFGTNYTYDYIKGGASRIAFADSGPIHFLYNGSKSSFIAGGTVYLPHAGNVNCDHFRLGAGIMATPSSGSFHFLTANGNTSPLYAGTLYSADVLALNEPMVMSNNSVFDKINSIDVIETKNGLRLHNPISNINAIDESPEVVKTVYNEEKDEIKTSIDYTSAISTLWKAVQELKQEVEMLKNKNEGEL